MQNGPSQEEILKELAKAMEARVAGLEGRARVCARRAAGLAAQSFLMMNVSPNIMCSSQEALIDLLQYFPNDLQLRQKVEHLTMRVDEAYSLPDDIDLLEDARKLIMELEEGSFPKYGE